MNFKINESKQKLRGGFYTPPEIAELLVKWVSQISPRRLLEPGCGNGTFLRTIAANENSFVDKVIGIELDAKEAGAAKSNLPAGARKKIQVLNQDFLEWFLMNHVNTPKFDAIVGNPPYVRYQYMDKSIQDESQKIFELSNLSFTKHTNVWVAFVIASLNLLKSGGRLAFVLPAEIIHVIYAESLRKYMMKECSRILIYDLEDLWFDNALQGAVLVLAEKKSTISQTTRGVSILPMKRESIASVDAENDFRRSSFINGSFLDSKWTKALLNERGRSLYQSLREINTIQYFSQIADVDVGIVTGANEFFLVPDSVVKQFKLKRWSYPMFGRSYHVGGVTYTNSDHKRHRRANLPTNFLWLKNIDFESLPPKAKMYIREGESQGLNLRYKCRIREPWFTVPSVYATEVGLLKRAHLFPRLILNRLRAFTTDTAYRIKLKQCAASRLVYSFVNSLTALSSELEGRHYGGGVLELVPSEIERLLVPISKRVSVKIQNLDKMFRANLPHEEILSYQDKQVLLNAGLTSNDTRILHECWDKLSKRRRRVSTLDSDNH